MEELLFASASASAFVQSGFARLKKEPGFSYAAFSRRAGFKARSFARELALGNRRPTLATVSNLSRGFHLSPRAKKLLHLMILVENPAQDAFGRTKSELKGLLETTKRSWKTQSERKTARNAKGALLPASVWAPVFAAIGPEELGSTPEELASKTGRSSVDCISVARTLVSWGMAHEAEGRFFPKYRHWIVDPKETLASKEFVISALEQAQRAVMADFDRKEALFHTVHFTVAVSAMPELRDRLRELLNSFAEKHERSDGDRVATLTCAFRPSC